MNKSYDLLTLGEVLLRLSPTNGERLIRGDVFQKYIGGAELNVASGAGLLGLRTGMITKLPGNDLGIYAKNTMLSSNVHDTFVTYDTEDDARLGIYYYESGTYPKMPHVVYDRKHTSINKLSLSDFPEEMYTSARCFHTSGITLALSPQCRKTAVEMIKRFKEHGAIISFDVNFRANLWSGPEAKACIEEILPYVDIFFCSESTARLTFLKEGSLKDIMKSFSKEYPISVMASTQRIVHSPKSHTFGSIIYSAAQDTYYEEEPYTSIEIVDRIGSGDAYISGALFGLLTDPDNFKRTLEFGNAVSAVKNSVPGDMQAIGLKEIESIIQSHKNAGIQLEMNR